MLPILDKMTQKCKRIYKKLYKIWTDKLCSLKFIANVFLALVVTNYTEKFRGFKKGIKQFLQLFETQYTSTLYRSSHQWFNSIHFLLFTQSLKEVSLVNLRLLKLLIIEHWEVSKNTANTFGRHKKRQMIIMNWLS